MADPHTRWARGERGASLAALRLARKDVGLILDAAGEVDLPVVRATLRQFDRALELGQGDEDMSAVYYASASVSPVSKS